MEPPSAFLSGTCILSSESLLYISADFSPMMLMWSLIHLSLQAGVFCLQSSSFTFWSTWPSPQGVHAASSSWQSTSVTQKFVQVSKRACDYSNKLQMIGKGALLFILFQVITWTKKRCGCTRPGILSDNSCIRSNKVKNIPFFQSTACPHPTPVTAPPPPSPIPHPLFSHIIFCLLYRRW